jgi:hypothetical protein
MQAAEDGRGGRGNWREAIFPEEGDRELFLKSLEEACARTGYQVHAWCLQGIYLSAGKGTGRRWQSRRNYA